MAFLPSHESVPQRVNPHSTRLTGRGGCVRNINQPGFSYGFPCPVKCAWVYVMLSSRWLPGRNSGPCSDIGEGTYIVVRTQTPCLVCDFVRASLFPSPSSFANAYDCRLFAAAETLPVSESFVHLLREILVCVLLCSFFFIALFCRRRLFCCCCFRRPLLPSPWGWPTEHLPNPYDTIRGKFVAICCLSGLPHDRHFSAVTYGAMDIFLRISVKVRREVVCLCRNTT